MKGKIFKDYTQRTLILSRYLNDIRSYKQLSDEQIMALKEEGRIEDIVKSSLRLAISIAKCYIGCGIELADLIQEANIGLFEAAQAFDLSKGRWSCYVFLHARKNIVLAIQNYGAICRRSYTDKNKVGKVELDAPVGDSEEADGYNFMPSYDKTNDNKQLVDELLNTLNDVERRIIERYYLEDIPRLDCQIEIKRKDGRAYTTESVRLTRNNALKKMRKAVEAGRV